MVSLICFDQFYSDLNEHVSSGAAPKAPILVKGEVGCGKSLLLAKWLVFYSMIYLLFSF